MPLLFPEGTLVLPVEKVSLEPWRPRCDESELAPVGKKREKSALGILINKFKKWIFLNENFEWTKLSTQAGAQSVQLVYFIILEILSVSAVTFHTQKQLSLKSLNSDF